MESDSTFVDTIYSKAISKEQMLQSALFIDGDKMYYDVYEMLKINPPDQQSRSDALAFLAQVSVQPLIENSIVKHVGSVPMACQNCPLLQTSLNCNQCNRWNQQE